MSATQLQRRGSSKIGWKYFLTVGLFRRNRDTDPLRSVQIANKVIISTELLDNPLARPDSRSEAVDKRSEGNVSNSAAVLNGKADKL